MKQPPIIVAGLCHVEYMFSLRYRSESLLCLVASFRGRIALASSGHHDIGGLASRPDELARCLRKLAIKQSNDCER